MEEAYRYFRFDTLVPISLQMESRDSRNVRTYRI